MVLLSVRDGTGAGAGGGVGSGVASTVMKHLQKNCDFQNFGKREGVEVTLNAMIY